MKTVLLLSDNPVKFSVLASRAEYIYETRPLSGTVPENTLLSLMEKTNSICILDCDEADIAAVNSVLKLLSGRRRVICVSDSPTAELKAAVLHNGIAELTSTAGIELISAGLSYPDDSSINGSVLALENENSIFGVIKNICSRAGVQARRAENTTALTEEFDRDDYIFLLVNIGNPGLCIKELLRLSYENDSFKKIPLLAYYHTDRGIYIHEITNGLNRITGVILETKELYSFLIKIFYHTEVSRLMSKLNTASYFENVAPLAEKNIVRYFFENRKKIFDEKFLPGFSDNSALAENALRLILRAGMFESLKWLV